MVKQDKEFIEFINRVAQKHECCCEQHMRQLKRLEEEFKESEKRRKEWSDWYRRRSEEPY